MRIILWNMAAGSPRIKADKHQAAWEYLFKLKPDIALIQEACTPISINSSFTIEWKPAYGNKKWGTAILSMYPITKRFDIFKLEPKLETAFNEIMNLVQVVEIEVSEGLNLTVVSVHSPARTVDKNNIPADIHEIIKLKLNKNIWYADVIFGAIRNLPKGKKPFLVGGDWNTARLFDEVYWPRGNVEFFERMEKHGLYDCVFSQHGKEIQTWFREGDNPYQLDHLFCDENSLTQIQTCEIDQYPAEKLNLSDHAPVIAEFKILNE